MANALGRLLLLAGVLAFGIFFGISLTSNGIEQIHGPIAGLAAGQDGDPSDQAGGAEPDRSAPQSGPDQREQLPAAPIEPVRPSASLLDKLIDKVGGLLNLLADYLIRLIVKLGETVLS